MAGERADAPARCRGRAGVRRGAPGTPEDGDRGKPRAGDEQAGGGARGAPGPRGLLVDQGGAPPGRQPVLARHAAAGPPVRRALPAPVAAVHPRGDPDPWARRGHDHDRVRHHRQSAVERGAVRRVASAGRAEPVRAARRRSPAAGCLGGELAPTEEPVRRRRDARSRRARLHRRRRAGDHAWRAGIAGPVSAPRHRARAREGLRAGRGGERRRESSATPPGRPVSAGIRASSAARYASATACSPSSG